MSYVTRSQYKKFVYALKYFFFYMYLHASAIVPPKYVAVKLKHISDDLTLYVSTDHLVFLIVSA